MPTDSENTQSSMLHQPTHALSTQPTTPEASNNKAIVIGLYGVPGCGKTFLLGQLECKLGKEQFAFFDGSKMIDRVVPGGLDTFKTMEKKEQTHWRQHAIDTIGKECSESAKVGIVAGHFMFWSEGEEGGQQVYTQNDMDTFTHILYVDVPAEVVSQRRLKDIQRSRPSASVTHIQKWQQAEKDHLRELCRNHAILFSLVSENGLLDQVLMLLRDFQLHNEKYNLSRAERRLDEVLTTIHQGELKTVMFLDGDRTLVAEDTGLLFWEKVSSTYQSRSEDCPLKKLFSSPLGYSYTAFRQAALLYEEVASVEDFDTLCQEVASMVTMQPEFLSLLQLAADQEHVGAVVVSCGLRQVWEKVLEREGLSKTVKVVAGGRIADGFVVTAAVKAGLVARSQDFHHAYVWAFGDSSLDLDMLSKADQAIVVVGEDQNRSKSMDAALTWAIENKSFQGRQVLLPSKASPRLDTTKLPLIQLTEPKFVDSVLGNRDRRAAVQVLDVTERNTAKLLMTPMRDAKVSGQALREAHRRVGWYLANEFLTGVVGVEEYRIPHVQGHHTSGHRLFHEQQTTIVALMRGGEPMAFGVNDAFPLAMFVHADGPEDVKLHHLRDRLTVVLVDSVLNSGRTVVQFVERIRCLHATIRIVIVAGVAHTKSIEVLNGLAQEIPISLVALRLSRNQFTGKGTTDTGNRLFNTTHL